MTDITKYHDGWALVSGATSGISEAFAQALAQQGFKSTLETPNKK